MKSSKSNKQASGKRFQPAKNSPTLESTSSLEPKPKSKKKKIIILVLLGVLLLSGATFAGYKYSKSNSDEAPVAKEESSTPEEETPAPAEPTLKKARPVSGAFEVEVPVGWVSSTCADNPDILFLAPTTELLGKCASEYFGTVAVTTNKGNIGHNEEYYTSDDSYASVKYSSVTVDSIPGYKVSYTVATEGELGYPPVGTFEYIYNLYDSTSNQTFRPAYRQLPSDSNYQSQFVQIAESFNKL